MNHIDEMLQNLLRESEQQLPYRPNSVRKDLDFRHIPQMIYSDPCVFLKNCISGKEEYICCLFNCYYAKYNPVYYPDDPKVFTPEDFRIFLKEIDDKKRILFISLPEEFMGSSEYCTAYVLAYWLYDSKITDLQFFTIEDTSYGRKTIGFISNNLEHKRIERSTGKLDDDIGRVLEHAFSNHCPQP